MKLTDVPAGVTDWSSVVETNHLGLSGTAAVRAVQMNGQQIRLVTYSPGYVADHWCNKGHLTFVVWGAMDVEHIDGSRHRATAGTSYHVPDGEAHAHRLSSPEGATLFIVD
jgi:quercetin dioxygenase-like cupin family protein